MDHRQLNSQTQAATIDNQITIYEYGDGVRVTQLRTCLTKLFLNRIIIVHVISYSYLIYIRIECATAARFLITSRFTRIKVIPKYLTRSSLHYRSEAYPDSVQPLHKLTILVQIRCMSTYLWQHCSFRSMYDGNRCYCSHSVQQ